MPAARRCGGLRWLPRRRGWLAQLAACLCGCVLAALAEAAALLPAPPGGWLLRRLPIEVAVCVLPIQVAGLPTTSRGGCWASYFLMRLVCWLPLEVAGTASYLSRAAVVLAARRGGWVASCLLRWLGAGCAPAAH